MTTLRPYTFIGAGAIGGTVAHALAVAGHSVVVVDADSAHVSAIAAHGLTIRYPDGREDTVAVAAAFTPETYPDDLAPIQCAVISTKSQHTREAASWAAPRMAADGYAVSLQNGINEPVIAGEVGEGRVLSAFVNIFTDYLEPGVVSFGGTGALSVGLPEGGAPDARSLMVASDFRAYGPVTASANVAGYRFAKRGFGSILGLTSVVDAPMADVVRANRDLAAAIATESTEVAVRAGIVLEAFDGYEPYAFRASAPADVRDAALDRLEHYLDAQPKDRSGGFRDIAVRRRPLEHGLIDDGYKQLAESVGVPQPVSRRLGEMLGEISRGERAFSPDNMDELRAAISAR